MTRSTRRPWARCAALAVLASLVHGCSAPGVDREAPPTWFINVGTGQGDVSSDDEQTDELGSGWRLAFAGGAVLGDHWLLGLELGGIGLEAGDLWDPTEGHGLSDTFLITEYHPSLEDGWYLHAGAGRLRYYDNAPGTNPLDGSGWGARVGVGYEWRGGERTSFAILVTAGSGRIDSLESWEPETLMISAIWSYR